LTPAKVHEVNILDIIIPEAGAFYVMDRAYIDFARLYRLHLSNSFFVIRAKSNINFKRIYSHPIDRTTGVLCDQTISLTGFYPSKGYPDKLRQIKYHYLQRDMHLVFITNNFRLQTLLITKIFKERWQIELFFKWIKQHLRIKSFYGTKQNAVKKQIWIAISVYLLVIIAKKRLNINLSLYTFLQILSISIFKKSSILELANAINYRFKTDNPDNQLNLFNL